MPGHREATILNIEPEIEIQGKESSSDNSHGKSIISASIGSHMMQKEILLL